MMSYTRACVRQFVPFVPTSAEWKPLALTTDFFTFEQKSRSSISQHHYTQHCCCISRPLASDAPTYPSTCRTLHRKDHYTHYIIHM